MQVKVTSSVDSARPPRAQDSTAKGVNMFDRIHKRVRTIMDLAMFDSVTNQGLGTHAYARPTNSVCNETRYLVLSENIN